MWRLNPRASRADEGWYGPPSGPAARMPEDPSNTTPRAETTPAQDDGARDDAREEPHPAEAAIEEAKRALDAAAADLDEDALDRMCEQMAQEAASFEVSLEEAELDAMCAQMAAEANIELPAELLGGGAAAAALRAKQKDAECAGVHAR